MCFNNVLDKICYLCFFRSYYFFVSHVFISSTATLSKLWLGSLQRTGSSSTINRLYHRFFLDNDPKTSCLKSNILSQRSVVHNSFTKPELMSDHSEKTLKSLMYLLENLLGVSFASVMLQVYSVYVRFYGLIRVYSNNFGKNGFTIEVFSLGFSKISSFQTFLRIFCQISLPFF